MGSIENFRTKVPPRVISIIFAYDRENDTLYVAAEGDNAIYKLKGAGTTTTNLGKVET